MNKKSRLFRLCNNSSFSVSSLIISLECHRIYSGGSTSDFTWGHDLSPNKDI